MRALFFNQQSQSYCLTTHSDQLRQFSRTGRKETNFSVAMTYNDLNLSRPKSGSSRCVRMPEDLTAVSQKFPKGEAISEFSFGT